MYFFTNYLAVAISGAMRAALPPLSVSQVTKGKERPLRQQPKSEMTSLGNVSSSDMSRLSDFKSRWAIPLRTMWVIPERKKWLWLSWNWHKSLLSAYQCLTKTLNLPSSNCVRRMSESFHFRSPLLCFSLIWCLRLQSYFFITRKRLIFRPRPSDVTKSLFLSFFNSC